MNDVRLRSTFVLALISVGAAIILLDLVRSPVQAQAQGPVGSVEASEALVDATEPSIETRNVLTVLRDGGPMMLPIAGCSFLLFVFVFERAISLRMGRVIPGPFVKRFIHQLQENELTPDEALQLCDENQSPVAEVFAAAAKKWGRPTVEVEQAALDAGERVANRLRKYLRLFHGIATISPLLGLLGTVLGMINAFNAVATSSAMGRPELLAAGISQALITTASGLSLAIPAIITHLYFVSRVDRLVMEIDARSQDVVNAIAADGWKQKTSSKSVRSTRAKAA